MKGDDNTVLTRLYPLSRLKRCMVLKIVLPVVSLLVSLASATLAQTAPLQQTNFGPPIKLGAFGNGKGLGTQDPQWSLFANGNGVNLPAMARIQTAFVAPGSPQALQIFAVAGHKHQCGVSTKVAGDAQVITYEADVQLRSSLHQTAWQFAAGDDSAHGFVGGFNVLPDGHLQLITKGSPPQPATTVPRDVWKHFAISFDLRKQTSEIWIDGQSQVTNLPFLAPAKRVAIFQFDTFAGGDDTACLANFVAHAGPPTGAPAAH